MIDMSLHGCIALMEDLSTSDRRGFSCRTEDGKTLTFTDAQMVEAKAAAARLLEYFTGLDRAPDAG